MAKGNGTTRKSSAASPNGVGSSAMATTEAFAIPKSNVSQSQFYDMNIAAQNVFDNILNSIKENQTDNKHNLLSFDNISYHLNKAGVETSKIPASKTIEGTKDAPIQVIRQGIKFKISGQEYKLIRTIRGYGGEGQLDLSANGNMKPLIKQFGAFEFPTYNPNEKITTTIEKLKFTTRRLWAKQ